MFPVHGATCEWTNPLFVDPRVGAILMYWLHNTHDRSTHSNVQHYLVGLWDNCESWSRHPKCYTCDVLAQCMVHAVLVVPISHKHNNTHNTMIDWQHTRRTFEISMCNMHDDINMCDDVAKQHRDLHVANHDLQCLANRHVICNVHRFIWQSGTQSPGSVSMWVLSQLGQYTPFVLFGNPGGGPMQRGTHHIPTPHFSGDSECGYLFATQHGCNLFVIDMSELMSVTRRLLICCVLPSQSVCRSDSQVWETMYSILLIPGPCLCQIQQCPLSGHSDNSVV